MIKLKRKKKEKERSKTIDKPAEYSTETFGEQHFHVHRCQA
jgi:hypothetical protein